MSNRRIKHICIICDKSFIPGAVNTKVCSTDCYNIHSQNRRKKRIKYKICLNCNKDFSFWKSKTKFCSTSCGSKYNIKFGNALKGLEYGRKLAQENLKPDAYLEKICVICGSSYKAKNDTREKNFNRSKACSEKCRFKLIGRISNVQRELFYSLKTKYPEQEFILEATINDCEQNYFADILLPLKKIIIEFYGDYWHCNPKKYKENYVNEVSKHTAKEIWIKDEIRTNILKSCGYEVVVVWELDYRKNKEKVLEEIDKRINYNDRNSFNDG